MQLAVAGYACPGQSTNGMTNISTAGIMPDCCEHVDLAQPGLCKMHNQAGKQSLDKPHVPDVQSFIPVILAILSVVNVVDYPIASVTESTWLLRSTAPPIAIRHCCFRI